ncbi:hypothetical protein [Bradyrhizobium sp. AUGA SZCCT0160]|uniref:hypothetical protein n=1 Tax=Bradyrhizobium sp. AUGA SZCCT0160 TaxID=2807662 RepID=UPI001BA8FC6E|nr:hypothetical protein [Bradyrhizobium sp. AUGA SZCCT0160]MBR1188011.1 hypothetical protein [Bradyrhizobium sp. AUGA SZCCT0160]MBR1188254.1 hypothetical protein [Bradyrhizobium sp. AUGA SZCCT0160]
MVITIMAITGIGAGTMAIIIIMAITIITTAITTTTVTTTTNDKKPADAVGRLTSSAGSPLIHAAHVPLTPVGSRASGE